MFIKYRFMFHTIHPNQSFLPYSFQLASFQIYTILEILNLWLNFPLIKSFNLHYPSSLDREYRNLCS